MTREQKIVSVVKKMSLKETDEADDEYWANATVEERMQELMRLRKLVYGDLLNQPIQKVGFQGSVEQIENNNLRK